MKTGNDLVAEQVLYSTCFCYLPYRANQRNFAVLQRVAFYLRYSSIGCIDSFLSLHRVILLGYAQPHGREYPHLLRRTRVDKHQPPEDGRGVQHPPA